MIDLFMLWQQGLVFFQPRPTSGPEEESSGLSIDCIFLTLYVYNIIK